MAKVDLSWDSGITSKDWDKMCSTDHGVDVNDPHDPIPITVEIWLDNPHAIVWVGAVKGFTEVMDERTRKALIGTLE